MLDLVKQKDLEKANIIEQKEKLAKKHDDYNTSLADLMKLAFHDLKK